MRGALRRIRPGEGRDTWVGFACLFVFLASHATLETARDALFLANISASQLPWMYIAIGACSLLFTQLQKRGAVTCSGRTALGAANLVASLVTLGFFVVLPALGVVGLYALYVWSGVLATLVLIHFWTLMGDLFSVSQAKRLYSFIGAGSVLGAIAGTAAAGAIARVTNTRYLLLFAAAGFFVSSVLPWLLTDRGDRGVLAEDAGTRLVDDWKFVLRSNYAGRVTLLLMLAAAALTVADFLFKQVVVLHVDAAELASFFAGFYFVLNVLSLFVQVALVSMVLRRFDLSTALAVLPFMFVVGAVGVLAAPLFYAALFIKGADGSLRYSLHRTASELLFVPLSDAARRRIKGFVDVIGQRGGQALASVVILVLLALDVGIGALGGVLAVLAGVWFAVARNLRPHYLELFRRRLRRNELSWRNEFPELDVGSLESLIAALDSPNDDEVIAALTVLEHERKERLVPGLILYHPSERVVVAALDLFARTHRSSVSETVERLLDHPSAVIRAAAIAARSVLAPDGQLLRLRLSTEESAEVRATIMVNLIAAGEIVGSDAQEALEHVIRNGTNDTKIALAEAIGRRSMSQVRHCLQTLAHDIDSTVRAAAVRATESVGDESMLPTLIDLLADEEVRTTARHALPSFGRAGFDALVAAFGASDTPRGVRWQIPGALSDFDRQEAASQLLAWLPTEREGTVRFRIIRALQTVVELDPSIQLDARTLDGGIRKTVERAYRYVDRLLALEQGTALEPARKTRGHELLVRMLEGKLEHAIDRLLRLLSLRYPGEDFETIRRGLASGAGEARASGIELLENLLPPPLRGAVVALVDDTPRSQLLAAGTTFHQPLGLDYEGLLRHMLDSGSETAQDLTAFHVGELGLADAFRERFDEIRAMRSSRDIDLAIEVARLAS